MPKTFSINLYIIYKDNTKCSYPLANNINDYQIADIVEGYKLYRDAQKIFEKKEGYFPSILDMEDTNFVKEFKDHMSDYRIEKLNIFIEEALNVIYRYESAINSVTDIYDLDILEIKTITKSVNEILKQDED